MQQETAKPIHLASEADTIRQGQCMAASLRPGDAVALVGGLGAGKTHLAKGIVQGLGSPADVSSPTFTLVHEYLGGRLPVFHFDWYRLDSPRELVGLGWDDYLDAGGICLVEWADKFPDLMPTSAQWWTLRPAPDGGRTLCRLVTPLSPAP